MKKLLIFLIAVLAVIAGGIAALKATGNWGRLALMQQLNTLQNKEYTFTASMDTSELDGLGISGTVSAGNLAAVLSSDGTELIGIYHEASGETVYDLMPAVNSMVSSIQSSLPFNLDIASMLPDQVTVSQSQLNDITGNSDSTDYFELLNSIEPWQAAIGVKTCRDVSAEAALLGTDGISYYSISSQGMDLIIGTPESFSDHRLSLWITDGTNTAAIVLTYEEAEVEDFVMPEVTVSDDTINTIQQLYEYWQQLTAA